MGRAPLATPAAIEVLATQWANHELEEQRVLGRAEIDLWPGTRSAARALVLRTLRVRVRCGEVANANNETLTLAAAVELVQAVARRVWYGPRKAWGGPAHALDRWARYHDARDAGLCTVLNCPLTGRVNAKNEKIMGMCARHAKLAAEARARYLKETK